MAGHFTVLVEVKETVEPAPIMNPSGYPVKGVGGGDLLSERRVIDRLRVVVSADTQAEAIEKAQLMLTAGHPGVAVVTSDQQYIAPGRPIRDNPQA